MKMKKFAVGAAAAAVLAAGSILGPATPAHAGGFSANNPGMNEGSGGGIAGICYWDPWDNWKFKCIG